MRVVAPTSVHGCFDVVHNNGTTYVITSKSNPLDVNNSIAVTRSRPFSAGNPALCCDEGKVIVYKVQGEEAVVNGTLVTPSRYDVPSCTMVLTTMEQASARFLHHWCSYHRQLGVGFFLIYDNNSSDEEFAALVEASKPFPGLLIRWNYPYLSDRGFTAQASQQTHSLCISRGHARRVGLMDLDEYLVIHSGSFEEFLAPPVLRVHWRWFGGAGKTSTDPRDYTLAARNKETGECSKLICDPALVELAQIHQCWGPMVTETDAHTATLNHYRGLSNDTKRLCDMSNHAACRLCAVETLDLVTAYAM